MTFKQIREIKAKHEGLELNTYQTNMFNNAQWASLWTIKFMTQWDMKDLFKYLDDNCLCYFIGKAGIHIQ